MEKRTIARKTFKVAKQGKMVTTSSELEKVKRDMEKTHSIELGLNKKEVILNQQMENTRKAAVNLEIDKKVMGVTTQINQIKTAALNERQIFEQQIINFEQRVEEATAENEARNKEIKEFQNVIDAKKAEIAKIQKEVAKVSEKVTLTRGKFMEVNIDIETTKQAIKQKESDIKDLNTLTATKIKSEENKVVMLESSKQKIGA